MQIQVAVAKIGKYASSESGDSLEMVERPGGGLSLVLVDGQRSGKSAKAISNLVAGKTVSLLAEGVRDGAAARAAHDYLYMHRGGKVSATLNIASVDMVTKSLVLSRNSHCPIIVQTAFHKQMLLDQPSAPIGVHRANKPKITEMGLETGMLIVIFTDGILSAGERKGQKFDAAAMVDRLYEDAMGNGRAAQIVADNLLAEALRLDDHRPADDISVLVLAVIAGDTDGVRRMQVSLPIPPLHRP